MAVSLTLAGDVAAAKKAFRKGVADADRLDLERAVREITFWSERDPKLKAPVRNALAAMRQSLRKRIG